MRLVALLSIFGAALLGCDATERDVIVRGQLTWTANHQTIVPCGSNEVLWVRVFASNPHFFLSRKVEELAPRADTADVIATFRGDLSHALPLALPLYRVDGVIYVNEIRSVELGLCT